MFISPGFQPHLTTMIQLYQTSSIHIITGKAAHLILPGKKSIRFIIRVALNVSELDKTFTGKVFHSLMEDKRRRERHISLVSLLL